MAALEFDAADGQRYRWEGAPAELAPPGRRRRRFTLEQIEQHHGVPRGTCARCGVVCVAERAHLIDFAWGGPDTLDNIVPLCSICHRRSDPEDGGRMPIFVPGEEWWAQLWLSYANWSDWRNAYALELMLRPLERGAIHLAPAKADQQAINEVVVMLRRIVGPPR